MDTFAPVVLFTYRRLEVTKKVIESLLENKECSQSELIIYSDGPRSEKDIVTVDETRKYLKTIKGFKSIEYIFRENNLGLSRSFISGITETFQKYEKAIFLEDDNLLSPFFLDYINMALEKYKSNPKVICITGYSWPLLIRQSKPYFVRGAETWSMATWKRGWAHFNHNAHDLMNQLQTCDLKKLFSREKFAFYGMLQQLVNGEIDSWGVRWWTSAFVNDMYCLYPNNPFCVSIGFGADSVHNVEDSPFFRLPKELVQKPFDENKFPKIVTQTKKVSFLLRIMNKGYTAYFNLYEKVSSYLRRRLIKFKWLIGK
jgi:hypothetical protein